MYNQGPTVGRINPAFTGPQDGQYQPNKFGMGQPVPPPYYPNTGFQFPRADFNPNPSGYPNQPYGAPGGPHGPYAQQSYPGMSPYPQGEYGHNRVIVEPTVFVTPAPLLTSMPDYMCYSIFTMLFCCLPLGIAATVCSCNTRDANVSGQQELAVRSSRTAFILNNIALCLGILIITAAAILLLYMHRVF
ncbi:synapse differentiation-inducing gene protein 1-like [Labeo rohita]|uniref:Synapse differentiation-inducing gene protein 1-like n=1 Tax=Labeo rohita TaxID=84645 RepID=A0A498LJC2_LABRO|nr:transmembrane protein 91 isoform X1 [Labeo rohita]RXN07932.1 synapse differentiation-inducing gene protein 1-like [Labeo rohita]RXN23045.1 synapse differentiation-inducing gene protein 1-like [Labeo rohita]